MSAAKDRKTIKLCCRACGSEVEIARTSSVGEMMASSGWNPIMDGMGRMTWVCLDCGDKIGRLAREIKGLLAPNDDSHIHFDALLRFKVKP